MAIAFVQSGSNGATSGTTVVVTLAAAPTKGNALVAFVGGHSSAGQPTVTGGGVTWTQITSSSVNATTAIWVGQSASGANTAITCTWGGTLTTGRLIVAEFSGIVDAVVTATDVFNEAASGTASPAATNSITPAFNNELIVAVASVNSSALAITAMGAAGNSYSDLGNVINGDGTAAGYLIQVNKASTSTSWTITGTPLGWNAHIVSLKGRQDILDDLMASYPPGQPAGGRNWPTPDAAKQFDEMTSWTDFVILPSAASIAQQMEDGQAHDLLGGRNWPVPSPARQIEEMTNWMQRVILPLPALEDWDSRQRAQSIWWAEDEGDWVSDVFILLPPFDPTQLPSCDQQDIPSPRGMVWAEDDNPLNIFLPPPGWDDGFDFSQLPVMKMEDYREEGAIPIIPSVFDDDFLFSYQPTMKLDDDREYQMRIFIPVVAYDDEFAFRQQMYMKLDDDREYLMRIFIPTLAWDDDWQMASQSVAKLEEIDSPLQLFLPPFDPTQRPAGDDYDFAASRQWMLEEADSPLLIFLPPAPWVEDSVSIQRPYPPACLSVEPEGQWVQLIIVLAQPPPGEIPGRSVFHLRRGVHIFR